MSPATQPPVIWPSWAPRAIAAVAVGLAVLTPFVHTVGDRSPVLAALLAAAVAPWLLGVAGIRLHPLLFAVGVTVPIAVLNLAPERLGLDASHDVQLSLMLLVVLSAHLGAVSRAPLALATTAVAALVPLGRFLLEPGFGSWVFWSAGILLGTTAGAISRRQQQLVDELRAAQAALAADAARQERQRIAREVHDVIAHSLTVTMLHLTTARVALRRDLGKAESTLSEAERLGRQALADVRRAVGLLHDGPGAGTGPALPGLEELPALLDSYRAAGVPLEADLATDALTLSPAGSLAVYRTVQESLANAAKHAPGAPVEVAVRESDGDVLVRVADRGGVRVPAHPERSAPGGGAQRGLGLRAMEERVHALGGTVDAGPGDGGWIVTCRLPGGPAA